MRCASYTRTTSCLNNADITSTIIGQQNSRIQEYAKSRGWKIVEKYSDKKKDEFEETAFLQMKADAISRKFDCVVVDSLFRCGKNSVVAADLFLNMFYPAGIGFAVVEDDFYSAEKTDIEVADYLEKKAEVYRNQRKVAGIRRATQERVFEKYGYRHKNGKMELEIDPEAAQNIRRVFELICMGNSVYETAKAMTAEGIMAQHVYMAKLKNKPVEDEKAPWKKNQVKKILYNRLYIGEWTRTINGEKVVVDCPPIISKELFERAQAACSERKSSNHSRGRSKINPFSKRIFDYDSGLGLTTYHQYRLKIRIFRFIYPKPEDIKYERPWIGYDEVYCQVMDAIRQEKEKALIVARKMDTAEWENAKADYIRKMEEPAKVLFQKMMELESQNLPLYMEWTAGNITTDEYEFRRAVIQKEFEEYDMELQNYVEQIDKANVIFSKKNPWFKMFSALEIPDELELKDVKKWIERIESVRFEYVIVKFKHRDWLENFPAEWFEEDA